MKYLAIVAVMFTLGVPAVYAQGERAPPSPACSGPHFLVVAGAGVFGFQDGSLLIVEITEGDGCVNPAAGLAQLIVKYQIRGGTGRFESVSGELTMTTIQRSVLRNAAGMPALLMFTGEFEGTIAGVPE